MTARRPAVTYVITSTGIGGAERQVYDLASTFRARGWRVGVVSMLPMHEQFLPLEDAGVRLATLEMTQGVPDPRALVRLARLLRAWRPDVVHGHMVHANLLTRLARLVAPVPRVISTMHNQDEGGQWRYYAYRMTDRLSDVTTTVSPMALDEAVRRHAAKRSRLVLVPNGLDTEKHRPDPAVREQTREALGVGDEFLWLTAGRLEEAKRQSDLLSAMATVCRDHPRARLIIAGTGSLHDALQQQISAAGLEANASLLGLRRDVPALMQAADGFVLSSAWEGLPMVLLEAGASALPIVATDVGGSTDVVVEGTSGYLVPARRPVELAAAMERVMTMAPDERRTMGAESRRHVESSFDLGRIADRWEQLYRRGRNAR